MMLNEPLDPKALGQLLLMQSYINNLPTPQSIFSFVCKGLLDIPGISKVEYSETAITHLDAEDTWASYPVQLGHSFFGELTIYFSNNQLYQPYQTYLKNFVFMIGVVLEERRQRQQIKEHQSMLEQRIQERTKELNLEKESLIESQRRFRDLMSNIMLLSVMLDVNGDIIFCNAYFLDLTKYTANEVMGANWFELFLAPETRERSKSIFRGVMRGEDFIHHYDNEIRCKTGEVLVISWNHTLLRDANKQISGTASIGENITQRIADERQLKEKNEEIEAQNEEYLQLNEELNQINEELTDAKHEAEENHRLFYRIFDQAAVGVAIVDSETGRFKQINKKYCQICGYTEDEMLHSNFMIITHPDDLESDLSNMKMLKDGMVNEFSIDKRYIKKDHSVIWIRLTVSELERDGDALKTHIAIVEDISQRKQFEKDLEISRLEIRSILDTVPDYVIRISLDLNIQFINRSFPNVEIEQVIGTPIINWILPEYKAVFQEMLAEVVQTVSQKELITVVNNENEKPRWYLLRVRPLIENGLVAGFTMVGQDISQLKESEAELITAKLKAEESDRLKTAFLQNMSHEIRTPMNAIMGFSSLLVPNFDDKSKLQRFSDIIGQRCEDLLDIINDILDIAKIESGQLTIHKGECRLDELFQDLSSFFLEYQDRIGKKEIELDIPSAEAIGSEQIHTDKVKLKQIFINLISNALKFTERGRIKVSCFTENHRQIWFSVEDTGIGIPKDKQELVFERFAQIQEGINTSSGGTGLGLPIVKGLVNLLGGEIFLKSAPQEGSVFSFYLPLA